MDTGVLGLVLGPLKSGTDRVERAYVPYGYDDSMKRLPYEEAAAAAEERLEQMANEILERCSDTRIAAVGYAHGAPPVQRWAHRVGASQSRVPADRVAAVALLANPDRAPRTPVLPGRPNATTPAAVPGTAGAAVGAITLLGSATTGAGITATASSAAATATGYGALTGRVGDWCAAGDATCDTPPQSPLAATVANIAARSNLGDPIAAITTIAQALASTTFTAATTVINEDLHGTTLDELTYQPQASLGQRLVEASNPDTPAPEGRDVLAALAKLGGIGFHAVVAVAREVLTPATIAELATVGMASPWAAVGALGAKVAGAVANLVPPQTASRWINDTFEAITSTVTDPGELYALAGTARYSDTHGRTGAYRRTPATPDGDSTLTTVTNWLAAAADDLAAATPTTKTPVTRTTTAVPNSTGPRGSSTRTPPAPRPDTPTPGMTSGARTSTSGTDAGP
ncbi:cutinase family protein [Nocardia bhagyanarayanae]|uniref:cutinase family protein n=1 Tax=Nocardia bhagyanarayanae TaxID=1215925 RepID=UPI00163AE240|nr:cutinase family protein [Nocardia bhagyanarayanae]